MTKAEQWNYIAGAQNIADFASRPTTAKNLKISDWFKGPQFLHQIETFEFPVPNSCVDLPEKIQNSISITTRDNFVKNLFTASISRVGKWAILVNVTRIVIGTASSWLDRTRKHKGFILAERNKLAEKEEAIRFIIMEVQERELCELTKRLKGSPLFPVRDYLLRLNPLIDSCGLIRVGGKLANSYLQFQIKHHIL